MARPRKHCGCSVEGCDRPHAARGLCSMHYQREHRDPDYQRQWRAKNREHNRRYQREWYLRNQDVERPRSYARRIKAQHGLSMEEYKARIARGCAICGKTEGKLCLDHDHATGEHRDTLCNGCNTGLGAFADDPGRLAAAIAYLDKHKAPRQNTPSSTATERQQSGGSEVVA